MHRYVCILTCAWVFWHSAIPMDCTFWQATGTTRCTPVPTLPSSAQHPWHYIEAYDTRDACDTARLVRKEQDAAYTPRTIPQDGTTSRQLQFDYACLPAGLLPKDAH